MVGGMIEREARHVAPFALRAMCLCALGGLFWVHGPALDAYFFLFDDYKLVGQALELPLFQLISQPHFHYFRPFVHAEMSLEAAFFGWHHPSAYLALSLCIHMLSAWLLGTLLLTWFKPLEAACSALVFLLAPWTLEATFWLSCRFDLWATLWLLVSAHLLVRFKGGAFTWFWVGPLFLAFLSNESACVAALAGCVLWWRWGGGSQPRGRAREGTQLTLTLAVFLGLRWLVMAVFAGADPLEGAKGNLFILLFRTESVANLAAHLSAIAMPPLPEASLLPHLGHASLVVLAYVAALLKWRGRVVEVSVVVLLVLAPSLWLERDPASTAGGRLLYVPTLFLAPLLVCGWSSATQRFPRPGRGLALLFGLWGLFALPSASYQAGLWAAASQTSRDAIESYQGLVTRPGRYHLANMPYVMKEGPYILKAYAFEWYGGRDGSEISATPLVYEVHDGAARPMPTWGATQGAEAGVRTLRL